MREIANSAADKLSIRLQMIPRHLRAVASLANLDRYPPVVRALSLGRHSTRHLMILIAVLAVILAPLRLWLDVSNRFRNAEFHADMAAFHRGQRTVNMTPADIARLTLAVRRRPDLAMLHARLTKKWQDAAAHPWLPVEPDPPSLSRTRFEKE
jgi:hypothetical protein